MLIGDEIHARLAKVYELNPEEFVAPRLMGFPLFEFIIAVVLSQNTSDENAWKAFTTLKSKHLAITPKTLLSMREEELSESIRVAGMHRQRAARIKELARVFLEKDVESFLTKYLSEGRYEEARSFLLELPGVGYKTADVVLLMYYGVPTFPVDTHITRITLRLGFVKRKNYEEIRTFWMTNTLPSKYLQLHLLLITHGRRVCRARKPTCTECTIKEFCNHFRLNRNDSWKTT